VVEGIASYGNAVGVPNIAGDVYFHDAFTDNCLVNVVALGLLRADRILHSRVPPGGVDYDLVLVGKATDGSGFGGAAFASLVLDAGEAQANKSAVQVPDPFLKAAIMRATAAVVDAVFAAGIAVGFKDLGAGALRAGILSERRGVRNLVLLKRHRRLNSCCAQARRSEPSADKPAARTRRPPAAHRFC